MLRMRIRSLMQRLQGMPCPACAAPRHIEWREAGAADCEGADDGSPALCGRCGRERPITFVEICHAKA